MKNNPEENDLRIDTELEFDDELANLFAALDEVSASDELVDATLTRILGADEDKAVDDADVDNPASPTNLVGPGIPEDTAASSNATTASAPKVTATEGGKRTRNAKRSKWRTIRVAAIAACLAMALTGGVAYATPASYYDIVQDDITVTLGVNCFGVTVSATSNSEAGAEIVKSANLCNVSYEDSLARTIGQMEERNPEAPIEFGPKNGERETVPPHDSNNPNRNGNTSNDSAPNGSAPNGNTPNDGAPNGNGNPDSGNPNGDRPQDQGSNTPGSADGPDNTGNAGEVGTASNAGDPNNQHGQEQPGEPGGAGDVNNTGDSNEPDSQNNPNDSNAPNVPSNPDGEGRMPVRSTNA